MADESPCTREVRIASVLRSLGDQPLTRKQAERAGKLLGMHWTAVYRYRRRFRAHPVASALKPHTRGPKLGRKRLDGEVGAIVDEVLSEWLPREKRLAHPIKDLALEVARRCEKRKLPAPSRSTVARRLADQRSVAAEALAHQEKFQRAPGEFSAARPLEMVQIDHTQADVFVVDPVYRRVVGRPWITVAIDIATRCLVGLYLSMDRPSAATVALVLTRIVLPKGEWLKALDVDAAWPMHGVPECIHLDNAAEFHSRALKLGCSEYGISRLYRPAGRPAFGGHVERANRTLMERLRGLPGATAEAARRPRVRRTSAEKPPALTLLELERWLALEVAVRYHHSPHRGLGDATRDATPAAVWAELVAERPVRTLDPSEYLRFLIRFLPLAERSIQNNGLTLFRIRYWHPIFATWRAQGKRVQVRYHPEDLSRVYATVNGKTYIEARYADLRRPRISLAEQRAICRWLRARGARHLTEALIFKAIEDQAAIVQKARAATRRRPDDKPPLRRPTPGGAEPEPELDYSKPIEPYPGEIW